jgi:hypothetical protein
MWEAMTMLTNLTPIKRDPNSSYGDYAATKTLVLSLLQSVARVQSVSSMELPGFASVSWERIVEYVFKKAFGSEVHTSPTTPTTPLTPRTPLTTPTPA